MALNDREPYPIYIGDRHTRKHIGLPTTECVVRPMTEQEAEYYSQFTGEAKSSESKAYQQALNFRLATRRVR